MSCLHLSLFLATAAAAAHDIKPAFSYPCYPLCFPKTGGPVTSEKNNVLWYLEAQRSYTFVFCRPYQRRLNISESLSLSLETFAAYYSEMPISWTLDFLNLSSQKPFPFSQFDAVILPPIFFELSNISNQFYLGFQYIRDEGSKVEVMTKPRTSEGLSSTKCTWETIVIYQYWPFTPICCWFVLLDFRLCFRCLCNGHADSCSVDGICPCLNNTMEDCPSTSDCYKNQVQLKYFFCVCRHLLWVSQ